MDTSPCFFRQSYKGKKFCICCFMDDKPLKMGATLKGKNLHLGKQIIFFTVILFEKIVENEKKKKKKRKKHSCRS